MLEERTEFNRERRREGQSTLRISRRFEEERVCSFFPNLLTLDEKRQRTASSAEFVEMIDEDRNVLKRNVTSDESWCFMHDP
jgi:hypothetical protein